MLGDARSDLIAILALPLGQAKATSVVVNLETVIQQKTRDGVNQAIDAKIPEIRAQVHDEALHTVKPLFVGAAVVGGFGVLLGVAAALRAKRCAAR